MPTNLLGLLVEAAPTMTMARLLTINAVNLRELHWKGQVRKWWDQDRKRMSTLPEEVVLAMKQLRSLQVLSLCNWHIPTRDFYEILASCQETLHYLTLKSISGFKVKRPGSLPLSDNQVAQYHQSLHHDPVTSPPSAATEEEPDAGLDSNWNEFAFSDLFAESDSESDSESEIESSPRFRLHRLKELELCLDWTQSDSSVYLPQFCPGLESIKVNVNTDQKDLLGMIDTLRLSCPGLKQVHYKEGCSMAHEYGYFPPSEIYNSLIEDCTRPLSSFREKDSRGRKDLVQAMATTTITSGATDMDKSTISNSSALIESSRQPPTLEARTTLSGLHIGLEDGLTEAITTSILVNAATLETIQLRFRDRGDGPESMRWIQRILQSCPSLKNVQFDDVYYVLEDLDILFRPPALSLPDSSGVRPDWVCKGLESFSLQGTDRNWQSGRDRESLKRWKILQSMIQPWFVGGQTKYDCGKVFCFVLSQCPNLRWMRLNRTQFSMRPFHRSEFEDKVLEDDDQDEEDEVEND
ncbi:hypothetical protein BGZ83_008660 [Gryganskiella cystojenkinii]|nr:hypothetical protein BGZ83_008660 [Gryganskiella cystojenkinii]